MKSNAKLVPNIPQERVFLQPYDKEFLHTPNTGNLVLDQQDTLNLDGPNAMTRGHAMKRNAYSIGALMGVRVYDDTPRVNRQATMRQVSREITIKNC